MSILLLKTRDCTFYSILAMMLAIAVSCQKDDNGTTTYPKLEYSYIATDASEYGLNDGKIDLTLTGGKKPYHFKWSNGHTTEDIDSLVAGIYRFIAWDAQNDSVHDSILVSQPQPGTIELKLEATGVSIYNGNDGAIISTVTGGVQPYIYTWSNGSTTPSITGLTAGVYTLTVSDQVGQITSDSATISQPHPDSLVVNASITHPSGPGISDGSITLSISGGAPPYLCNWNDGPTSTSRDMLGPGTYTVTVSDQSGQVKNRTYSLADPSIATDIEGNTYPVVQIGDQIWFAKNLRVTKAPDGNDITSYAFNNQEANVATHGRLYTWNDMMNGSVTPGAQGICPDGWHIPTDEEFKTLEIALGMTSTDADLSNTWRGTGVGTAMKTGGTSGFEATMSGRMTSSGGFDLLGSMTYYWTSDEDGSYAWRRCLSSSANDVGRWNTFPKTYGFSVRCVKD